MALKLLDKVKLALSNSINDDKGWFRQGQFTPVKQIGSQIDYQKQNSPINRALYTGLETVAKPVYNSLLNIGALEGTAIGAIQNKFGNYTGAQKSFDKANKVRQYTGTQGSFDQGTGWNTIKKGGLDAVQTALTGKGIKYLTPTNVAMSGLLGGGVSKLSGGDFATGFGQGIGSTPQVMGFVGLTNPILSKALGGTKLAPLMASKAGSRITPAIANVAQGIGMDLARGTPTTAGSIGLDLLTGGLGGKTQFDMPSVKGFAMDKAKLDQIIQAEDMLKNPKNYVKDIYHATKKNKNLYIKQQSKEIQNKAAEVIDRLAAQYLPNKILSQTSGDSFKQIKALIDLNAQNGLTNVQMGIKSQSQPIKTGGEGTIKIKTGANLDNNQMGRTGNTLDQGKGQTQSISGKTPQGKPSPELPKQEQVVSRLSNPLGNQKSSSLTTSGNSTKNPTIKIRGFTESVQEAPKVTTGTKVKVIGEYTVKPTDELMGEAKALLTEGASIKDVKKVQNIDAKITATIQQAINLDKAGKHKEAAVLFNNLSETGTELGRGVHAFTLLNQMSPEAISLSAAGKIKKYNETAKVKIPELTADQQKMISDNVKRIQSITDERMKNIELNKLQEKISNFIPSSFVDKLITTWKAGLLTSPRTTGRNIVGNTIMQGGEMTASKPAAFADWLMSQKTGQRTTVGSLQGTLSGAKTGVSSAVDVMKYGFDPSETITKFDIKKVTWGNNPVEQTLKKYTDFVFNSLSAQDKPFWNSSYARSLYDQAATTALNQGQKGNQKLIQSLVDNSTEQMKTIATNDANYATFKDKNMISNIAAGFKRAAGQKEWSKLPAEIMAPFTGVPSSIVGKTIDYSPIGLIKGIKDAGKVVTQNVPDLQRRAAQEIGRGTVGTAVFALGSYLMSKGLITGQAKDDAERKQWELEGKQQNSIFVNGKWRSINSVGPQTLILLAGAKFDEEMKDPEGSMSKYGLTLVQDQLGQTFLSGVQQPLQAITDPNRYGKSYVGGQVASFVPNIVKDTSKALDPLARETDTGSFTGNIKTSVQSGIPIWRNQMTPKRDVLGNEIKQEPTGLGAYIDLFNSKTPISNNVVDELSRLNNAGYNATPSKLSSTQTIKGVKGKLNQQELDVLETKTGIAVSNGLDTLFKSNSYQKLDDEAKQKAVDDLVTKIRKQVRGTIDLTVMPDMGYTISADSPKGLGKVGLYGKSIITDPGQTIKAVIAGNPIRKVDGGAVILERKNGLGTLDAGDKTTQVDHIIPLSHGGTNDKENLQQLSNEEHKIKTEFNNYWLKEFQAGRISKKELQEKDKNWKNEIDSLPQATKEKLVAELSTDTTGSGKNYQIINDETGSISNIDLTFPEYPKLTGLTEADKALKSSYYSALSKIKTNATKLYNDGQLKAEEYNDILTKVSTSKSKSGSGKTKSKGGKITIKTGTTKFTPIKIKTYKPPTLKISKGIKKPSISNLKSRRTIKIKV
jgi:Zn-finger nucleic acid-binding protein